MIKLQEQKAIENEDYVYTNELRDLIRLQRQLFIEEALFCSIDECYNIWQNYSSDLCASWLFFPKSDDQIIKEIKSSDYFTTFEEYSK